MSNIVPLAIVLVFVVLFGVAVWVALANYVEERRITRWLKPQRRFLLVALLFLPLSVVDVNFDKPRCGGLRVCAFADSFVLTAGQWRTTNVFNVSADFSGPNFSNAFSSSGVITPLSVELPPLGQPPRAVFLEQTLVSLGSNTGPVSINGVLQEHPVILDAGWRLTGFTQIPAGIQVFVPDLLTIRTFGTASLEGFVRIDDNVHLITGAGTASFDWAANPGQLQFQNLTVDFAAVPEPSTWLLLAPGLAWVIWRRVRPKQNVYFMPWS